MYNSRGQSPRLLGEKYGRFGHTCGGFEYHFAICASSSLSQISLSENQSSNNAIKSPSICVVKFFVYLSSPFRFEPFFYAHCFAPSALNLHVTFIRNISELIRIYHYVLKFSDILPRNCVGN